MKLPITKQQAAVNAANDLANLMASMKSIREGAKAFVDKYNSEGYATTWAAMATAAQNADGSIGTADGTPVVSNPITIGSISRSKNALVAGVVVLQDYLNFCQNAAVGTAQRSQSIDDLSS